MGASEQRPHLTVGEVGEAGVLRSILAVFARAAAVTNGGVGNAAGAAGATGSSNSVRIGPGDDAAVLALDGEVVVTTDAMVEGPDFRRTWSTGFELGWKLAATNLSDLAAMGAIPRALTVTVMAPKATPLALLEEVAEGLSEACNTLAPGCAVVGGDLSTSVELAFSVTALGDMAGLPPVLRSGAQAGDTVAYAGELGLASAGLRLLYERGQGAPDQIAQALAELWQSHPDELAAQLAPSPPISLGRIAAEHGATAMLDVSDALSLDAARLGEASGVTLDLETDLLPQNLEQVLTGGEDHGLLATFGKETVLPQGFRRIGTVQPRTVELTVDGHPFEPRGWDPYA